MPKDQTKEVIAVAMSGGVDSSAVAAILSKAKEHDIFGITLDLHDGCIDAIKNSRIVCDKLNIEHVVINARNTFRKKVMDVFAEYYANGLTPNPCAICNRDIKFDLLLKEAKLLGATKIATGHYAKYEKRHLTESANTTKDQSYFLSLVSKSDLDNTIFPLGNIYIKDETRDIAKKFDLPNFSQKDSQDICFIKTTYKEFLKENYSNLALFENGEIILESSGNVLGKHNGIANYTIGQRKGLGISYQEPLYVSKIDKNTNSIVVTTNKKSCNNFFATNMNWLEKTDDKFKAYVKLRSQSLKTQANIERLTNNCAKISLQSESNVPIAPGQICAIYSEDNIIIGGGIISLEQTFC
ncbi:MAG: tRNA 2-thiouridine(34) synthase MnmA [Alphaproteobacteria bacterium]|nr:tRNA 2-thiouridine(34) synthase MnmA [Alphaproteobacteria bacterium]